MKTWAYLYEVELLHGLSVCKIVEVGNSESMPDENSMKVLRFQEAVQVRQSYAEYIEDDPSLREEEHLDDDAFNRIRHPYDYLKGWVECRADVNETWRRVDGVFMSAAAYEKFKVLGPSVIPRSPRVEEFNVFNFTDMDNFFRCKVKVDIDNYTPADVRRLIVAYYDGKIDMGITSNGGDPDGVKRYYRSIDRMVYTNILSLADIGKDIGDGPAGWRKYVKLLYPAVSLADYIAKRMPDANKFPLQDDSKLFFEYGLDPGYPIVSHWVIDPAPKWNVDWGDIRDDFLWDFITEVVDAAI